MKTNEFELVANTLFLTGLSGSGKDALTKIINRICAKLGIPVLNIHVGTLIARYAKSKKFLSEKIGVINNAAKLTDSDFADAMVLDKIMRAKNKPYFILINGGPRKPEDVNTLCRWASSGHLGKVMVLESIAHEETCKHRIFERTKIDKRPDLSIDGQPGVPDDAKIQIKLNEWISKRDDIVRPLFLRDMYMSIQNEGIDLKTLEENVRKMILIKRA